MIHLIIKHVFFMTRAGAMWKDIAVFKFEKGGERFFSSL